MIAVLFTLAFLFIFHPVHAQELIPYKNNPVVSKGSIDRAAAQPFVLKEKDKYSLWYSAITEFGNYRLIRAQSSNGIDWYDKKNIYITGRQNENDPFVVFENNKYTLYFASSNFGSISLWKTVSTDGVTFVPGEEEEILKADVSWEGTNLSCPSVIKENNQYYLFYSGSIDGNWGIGLATSTDGVSWKKCTNDPFIAPGASEHIIKYNGTFYLFFQSPSGLEVQQSDSLNGCDTVWTNRHIINSQLRDPSPIQMGNDLWLYGALPNETGYHIGLAANTAISPPTYPIVIIPGMFSSWNKQAILHNTPSSYDSWSMNPYVTEYSGLIDTLEHNGKVRNTDYYVFPYDWRKPITESVANLDLFLEQNVWSTRPYLPVQLVGHSLGGVVSRVYADMNPSKPIKKTISVGAPNQGVVQVYKPLISGEIDRENTLIWLAEKFVLLLNKSRFESDKITISKVMPVLSDIAPSFPFLKNSNGEYIESSIKNTLLKDSPILSFPLVPQTYLGGKGCDTPAGYVLGDRTAEDILSNSYNDGHPISSWTDAGDGVVLSTSSLAQSADLINANHGEVIHKKESLISLFSKLNMDIPADSIIEGKGTTIFPAILVFVQSPATMQVTHNENVFKENDGLIWIQNAENGEYSLNVTGTGEGEYTVNIWLITENNDKWIQFKKMTEAEQTDTFTITFNNETGGSAHEYIAPSPTPTPSPVPSPIPSPTQSPSPTHKPHNKPSVIPPTPKNNYHPYVPPKAIRILKQTWLHLFKKIHIIMGRTIKRFIPPYRLRR